MGDTEVGFVAAVAALYMIGAAISVIEMMNLLAACEAEVSGVVIGFAVSLFIILVFAAITTFLVVFGIIGPDS